KGCRRRVIAQATNSSPANRADPKARRCRSVERLDLHDPVVVIAADPEGHRRRRVVDEHRAHVGVGGHHVLNGGVGLGIEPHHAVGVHRRGPDFAVLVEIRPVRIRGGGRSYSVNFSARVSNTATLLPRYSATVMRSWSSITMRRARAFGVGIGYHVTFVVLASILPRWPAVNSAIHRLFCESEMT